MYHRPRMNLAIRQSLVRVEGTDVHWAEMGEGPPLVLLHGIADCHRTWRGVAPALAKSHRVLMPDLAGHGLSGRPDASYTIDWHAQVIGAWLGSLGLEGVDVVGHSYGGGVAQWLLLEHRERVRRLALVAPGGLGREVVLGLRMCAIANTVERVGQPFMAPFTRIGMRLAECGYDSEDIELLAWMNAMPGTARAFARTVKDVIDWRGQRRHFLEHAHRVKELPPIAIFWGDRDRVIPSRHGVTMLDMVAGTRLTHFDACGHFPHRQHEELFVRHLEEFLDAPEVAPARIRVPARVAAPAKVTSLAFWQKAWSTFVGGGRDVTASAA